MLHLQTQEDAAEQFERAMTALRDPGASFTAETIYTLSDLDGDRLKTFSGIWATMPAERRRALITRLVETAETNFELDFSAIINPALDDTDAAVRKSAVEGVLEDSPASVIKRVLTLAKEDALSEVRAAATKALAMFVLRGELGKLDDNLNQRLQNTVWALHNDLNEDLDVRRRALEAIANCGRDGVSDLIREAYYADELPMRVSAVFAMGRSCDTMWQPQIIEELASEYPALRYEAARAAGELELRSALPQLVELAYEGDREIQEMAIWALGEIGGKQVDQVLTDLAALADSTDDLELADAITEAQGAALLANEDLIPLFDFTDIDDEDDDELSPEYLYGPDEYDGEDDEDDELDGYYLDDEDDKLF